MLKNVWPSVLSASGATAPKRSVMGDDLPEGASAGATPIGTAHLSGGRAAAPSRGGSGLGSSGGIGRGKSGDVAMGERCGERGEVTRRTPGPPGDESARACPLSSGSRRESTIARARAVADGDDVGTRHLGTGIAAA